MSLVFIENFSHYGDTETYLTDGLWGAYQACTLEVDPDGVSSGKVLTMGENAGYARFIHPDGEQATLGASFRVWVDNLPPNTGQLPCLIRFLGTSGFSNVSLWLAPTGILEVWRASGSSFAYEGGTELGNSTTPVMVAGAWNHVEIKATFNASTGAVTVKVNGTEVIAITGANTINSFYTGELGAMYQFGANDASDDYDYSIKDVALWDTNGTENNDFLGDCAVVSLTPDGDDTLNWSPSTGATGYDLIDETTPSDADYIEADTTPPDAYVATMSDLPVDVSTVLGLQSVVRVQKTDSGAGSMQAGLVSGASTDLGADHAVTLDFTYYFDISELDPATGSQWAPSAVDAAKLQIDRTA